MQPIVGENPAPSAMPTKVGFVSLGCAKNLVDTEVMLGILQQAGLEPTPRIDDADVIVVNTCAFIDAAKQESVDAILEMARYKTSASSPVKRIVVAGCLVERYGKEIQNGIPEVDAIVGTGELENILQAAGVQEKAAPQLRPPSPFVVLNSRPEGLARESSGRFSRETWEGTIAELPNYLMDEHTPRILTTAKASAYIKIAEGCDHPCSFCIIPQLRGKFRSRPVQSVVAEAARLAVSGVKEITLIGQDTTCYGEDLTPGDGGPAGDLALLLEQLQNIESLRWIRFLYAYPNKITGKLLETIASNSKVCAYIDVPFQHASTPVLMHMKRGGSASIFLRKIENMRSIIPALTLRTSFIVGFPGETDADFEVLCDFVREARFDWLGVFSYSDEEGTFAYELSGKVDPEKIAWRRRKLMQLQKQVSRKKQRSLIGDQINVLMGGPSDESELLWEARGERHAPEIDGKILINDFGNLHNVQPGEFYRCQITGAHDYDLIAKLV